MLTEGLDFLRMHRSLDDNIIHSLNNLVPLSSVDNNHFSASTGQKRISSESCYAFKNKALFPSWKIRDDILVYCASIAANTEANKPSSTSSTDDSSERIVDERLDPYATRSHPVETKADKLNTIIKQEKDVERIVRDRSWKLINDRCGDDWSSWEDSLNLWKQASKQACDRHGGQNKTTDSPPSPVKF
ncbi:hypothetical protein K3495_g1314 [Podosphaera aphanis]|nr:hypothetical protein K3495_g1314 [Podosphaera aphanis]